MKFLLSGTLLFIASLILHQDVRAETEQSYVIVHKDVVQDSISDRHLRRIFMMKTRSWPNGQPVSLIVFASDNAKHAKFLKQTLKLFPYQLDREWNKLVYSGQSSPPVVASDTEHMMQIVSSTPGSIGYIVDDIPNGSVKILEVTGNE